MKKTVSVLLILAILAVSGFLFSCGKEKEVTLDDIYTANDYRTVLEKHENYRILYDQLGTAEDTATSEIIVDEVGCYCRTTYPDTDETEVYFINDNMTFMILEDEPYSVYMNYLMFYRDEWFSTMADTASLVNKPSDGSTESLSGLMKTDDGYQAVLSTTDPLSVEDLAYAYADRTYEEGDYATSEFTMNAALEMTDINIYYVTADGEKILCMHGTVEYDVEELPTYVENLKRFACAGDDYFYTLTLDLGNETVERTLYQGSQFYIITDYTFYTDAEKTEPMEVYYSEAGLQIYLFQPSDDMTLYLQ